MFYKIILSIAASGPRDRSRVKAFDGVMLSSIADFVPYGSSTAGVSVGAIPHFPAHYCVVTTIGGRVRKQKFKLQYPAD